MAHWNLRRLADEAAKRVQVKVGQPYELNAVIPFVNNSYEYAWNAFDWSSLCQIGNSILPAGSDRFVLPKQFTRLYATFPNGESVQQASVKSLRMGKIRWFNDTTQLLGDLAFDGEECVHTQPATPGLLYIKSSSASDTACEVRIEGELAGEYIAQTISTNGTTRVATNVQFDRITGVSKGKLGTGGYFTLSNVDGSIEYATISSWESCPYYSVYLLGETTAAAQTIYFHAKRRFIPMLNDLSVPFMDGIGQALVDGAVFLAYCEFQKLDSASGFMSLMNNRLRDIYASTEIEPMDDYNGRC